MLKSYLFEEHMYVYYCNIVKKIVFFYSLIIKYDLNEEAVKVFLLKYRY